MPPPLGLAIAGQALSSGYKIARGISMENKGERMEDSLVRPERTTPVEIIKNLDHAYALSKEGIRKPIRNAFEDNIAESEASTINNFRSRKGAIVGATEAGKNRRASERDLLVEDAKQKYKNELLLMKHRGIKAESDDQNFWYNKAGKYAEGMNRALALQGAGNVNINSGINEISGALTGYASGKATGELPTET